MDLQITQRPERPPGYTGKETRVPLVYMTNLTYVLIATLFVCSRLYARWRTNTVGKDDLLIVLGVGFMWGEVGSSLWGVSWGWGRHIWDIEVDHLPMLWVSLSSMHTCYQFSAMFIQLSVLALYLRLSISIVLRRIVYMMGFFVISFTAARLTLIYCMPPLLPIKPITACPTLKFAWLQCWYFMGLSSIMTDSIIWLLPIPMLCMHRRGTRGYADGQRGLRLRSQTKLDRKRVGLVVTFSFGLGACLANGLKLASGLVDRTFSRNNGSWDPWHGVVMQPFDTLELGLGIVGACLPALRKVFFSILPRWWKRVTQATAMGDGSTNDREQVERWNSNVNFELDSLMFPPEENEEFSTRTSERQETPRPGSQSDIHGKDVDIENDIFAHELVHVESVPRANQHTGISTMAVVPGLETNTNANKSTVSRTHAGRGLGSTNINS